MKHPTKPLPLTAAQQIVAYVDNKICGLSTEQERKFVLFLEGLAKPVKAAEHPKPATPTPHTPKPAPLKEAAAVVALLLFCAVSAFAADAGPGGRVDTKLLVGLRYNVQDGFTRDTEPKIITPGVLYHVVTNKSEGVIVGRTNLTANIHVVLPNPTNNIGRKFTGIPLGACVMVFSNAVVGTFTDSTTYAEASTFTVASNRMGTVFSTGTNWIGVLH